MQIQLLTVHTPRTSGFYPLGRFWIDSPRTLSSIESPYMLSGIKTSDDPAVNKSTIEQWIKFEGSL